MNQSNQDPHPQPPASAIFIRITLVFVALIGGIYVWNQAYQVVSLDSQKTVPLQAPVEPVQNHMQPKPEWLDYRIRIETSGDRADEAMTLAQQLKARGYRYLTVHQTGFEPETPSQILYDAQAEAWALWFQTETQPLAIDWDLTQKNDNQLPNVIIRFSGK